MHSGCLNLVNAWIPYSTCMLKYLINHRCGGGQRSNHHFMMLARAEAIDCGESTTSWQRQHLINFLINNVY